MDYYSTLGVGKNATDDDIKKAYRKLAMKHHPDRGGDESTFKKISEAYDVLSDPQKKQIVDLGGDPKNQSNGNSFNQGPLNSILTQAAFLLAWKTSLVALDLAAALVDSLCKKIKRLISMLISL